MPTTNLNSEENVNVNAWYDESMILKVWDKYIQSKSLNYFYDMHTECVDSIFDGENENLLARNAGILLSKNFLFPRLYETKRLNNESDNNDYSISVCGSVSNKNVLDNTAEFDPIVGNLEIALKQIVAWNDWNNVHFQVKNHIVLFPYNLSNAHWCLGMLQINFKLNVIDARLIVCDPLAQAVSFDDEVKEAIKKLLRDIFAGNAINMTNCSSQGIQQQFDGVSCGTIVAENGKDIIDGRAENLKKTYKNQNIIRALRIQHLNEIANDIFTLRQKENKFYVDPEVKLVANIEGVEIAFFTALESCSQLKVGFQDIQNAIKNNMRFNEVDVVNSLRQLMLEFKVVFKEYQIGNKNLFGVFFLNDDGVYQDCAFDTLAYFVRKKSKATFNVNKSNSFDMDNYLFPGRAPDLIRRLHLEEYIREELKENRIAILTGFKGYGKTVLAMQYFYSHLEGAVQYDYIAWVDCSNLSSISDSQTKKIKYTAWDKGTKSFNRVTKYILLNQLTKVISFDEINIASIHQKIIQEISGKNWLIIYDDVTSYTELIQESIPPNGHVICTSRYKNWPKSISVGPFSLEEGVSYFKNIFLRNCPLATVAQYRENYFENMNRETHQEEDFYKMAEKLTKKFYGYPLALAKAASYIVKNGLTLEKFIHRKKILSILFNFDKITLEKLIGVNLSKLEHGEKAKQLLYYCTYLNHEGITKKILKEIDGKVTKEYFDSKIFNKALNLLIRYSIINKDSSGTKNYFYIPFTVKRFLLNDLAKGKFDLDSNLRNIVLEVIKERLKNHLLSSDCDGEEFIPVEQDIYMWAAHAKTLHKNLKWREQFRDLEVNNCDYTKNEIDKLIEISMRTESLDFQNISNNNFGKNIKLIKNYACLVSNSYVYNVFIATAINKEKYLTAKYIKYVLDCMNEGGDNYSKCCKVLIPFLASKLDYWIVIEIRIHNFSNQQPQNLKMEVLAHDPYGNGDMLKNHLSSIPTKFLTFLRGERSNISFTVVNSNFNPQLQKSDSNSSGAVVIENILAIIRGNIPVNIYPSGCKDVRYQHLALINQYALAGESGEIKYTVNTQKIQHYVLFLKRHWGLQSVWDRCPEHIEALISTAEFIYLLGTWCFRHDLKRNKAYRCFLESQTLYLELLYQKALTLFDYVKACHGHLKVTFQLAITGDQFFSLGYRKITDESTITPASLLNTIKAYSQLKNTYDHCLSTQQLNDRSNVFNMDEREVRQKELHTLYYLSIALNDAKKGFNKKNYKWLKAMHAVFSQLLKQPHNKIPKLNIKQIDKDIRRMLSSKDFLERNIFNNFFENELNKLSLLLFDLKQPFGPQKQFEIICDIDDNLRIVSEADKKKNALKEESKKSHIKFLKKEILKKELIRIMPIYINEYYIPLLKKQKDIYNDFFEHAGHYNADPSKKYDIEIFQRFFSNEHAFSKVGIYYNNNRVICGFINSFFTKKVTYHFHNGGKIFRELNEFIAIHYPLLPTLKFIDDKYFFEDKITLVFFYKMIYRNIISNFMLSNLNGEDLKTLYLKINILDYIITSVSYSLIETDEKVNFGLSLIKLRINMHLDLAFICGHFEKAKAQKLIYCFLSKAAEITNYYYDKLLTKLNKAKENDRKEILKNSNELFLRVARKTFIYLKIDSPSFHENLFREKVVMKLPRPCYKPFQTILPLSQQEKLFITIRVNLQRAFVGHKAMLVGSNHFYVKKASELYSRVLKYGGYNADIDEMEKYKKIGNDSDIKLLDKKLKIYNNELDFSQNDTCKIFNIRMNRARLCYFLCRYEDALHDCMILCKENSANFKAFLLRAHVYYKMKKYSEAIADFQYYLKYRSGDDDASTWLSLAQKKEKLKPGVTDERLPQLAKKNQFIYAFVNEFLIQAKHYVDIFLGADQRLNKSEKTARVLSALSNLIPNVTASGPAGPVLISADTKPREAAIELSQLYGEQAGATKRYVASNISQHYDELKAAVHIIAKNIANDLERQIDELHHYSAIRFAKYSAVKMLKNIGLNKTNPELPIEHQLRQALFYWHGNLTWGKILICQEDSLKGWLWGMPFFSKNWTAEGALTRVGLFTESDYFWRRRGFFTDLICDRNDKYKYRHGTDDEAFRLGYKHMYKKNEEGKDESYQNVSLPFFKK